MKKACRHITLPTTKLTRIILVSNPGLRQRTKTIHYIYIYIYICVCVCVCVFVCVCVYNK